MVQSNRKFAKPDTLERNKLESYQPPDPIVVETDEQVKQIVGNFNEETEAMLNFSKEKNYC